MTNAILSQDSAANSESLFGFPPCSQVSTSHCESDIVLMHSGNDVVVSCEDLFVKQPD